MTDTTTELAKKLIVDLSDVTSWILLLVIIVISLLSYLKNRSLAETIETFKAELSRKEIKFTRHTELQIECYKNLYDLAVTFHFNHNKLLVNSLLSHEYFKANVKNLQNSFSALQMFCQRNRILIDQKVIDQMLIVQSKYSILMSLCNAELKNISQIEENNNTSNAHEIYSSADEEGGFVKAIIDRINKNDDVKVFEEEITNLRKLIEIYFKQLVG